MSSTVPMDAAALGIGPIAEPWPEVRRIAVLRGGGLGDFLFAVPAIHALAAAYPAAEIVLLGTDLHAELLRGRPSPIHEVIPLPPGITEDAADPEAEGRFFRQVCRAPIDLGVQLHGGGRWSNGFLHQLHPHWSVGSRTPDAAPLTRTLPFRYYQHETLRALEVAGLAGAPPVRLHPTLATTEIDRADADRVLGAMPDPVVALHPGAGDPRRRWPVERYARVAAHCLRRGLGVVVIGAEGDRELLAALRTNLGALVPDPGKAFEVLVGEGFSTICGVLARSCLLVGNDSGPRHLAAALGTPTIGVFWIGNVINAGPLGRSRDRILFSWTTRCPVCGRDCTDETAPRCEHDVSFVDDISLERLLTEVDELLP
ncbi:glycosyltransferase family 9 protein [Nocardia sp. CDC159]|uniref:Glycosyltransferase family 9 protein n=1 Tax=Nocardia pulmonis TaxID=2951408 RepID=A0A9X2IVU2_9NOCA|nr:MULTISPECIES: glycosyltransferase family 9 protein [Nocardia]MCM6772135.1 glycosyltransferase family 9 protein [Nocardia pulmonis]MCM6785207.1 glycosyltransferase family 9 protein [Nocardia sp. CDC159]